jgi:hypothetical protein
MTNFDIDQSLKFAPPIKFKGMNFLKRIIVDLDNDIVVDDDNQARHKNCIKDHVCNIADSYKQNGWIYTQTPPWAVWDAKAKKYVLKDGFHRLHAAKTANWNKMLLDVYLPESKLDERLFQLHCNQNHTPKRGSDSGDIVNSALAAIREGELANDELSVREFVMIAGKHLSKNRRESIFIDIMNSSASSKYRVYLAKGIGNNNVKAACKYEFKIPYEGDANFKDTGAYGYVTTEKTGRMTLMNAIKLLAEKHVDAKKGLFKTNKIPNVLIYAYMEAPGHTKTLREQREDWVYSFDKTLKSLQDFCEMQTGMPVSKFPIKFAGFLPQLIDNDPAKGGNPVETDIVDINSKPVDWRQLV